MKSELIVSAVAKLPRREASLTKRCAQRVHIFPSVSALCTPSAALRAAVGAFAESLEMPFRTVKHAR